MSYHNAITTKIRIPAYSAKNTAFLIELDLKATSHKKLLFKTSGHIATALKRALKRAIEIITSIHHAWKPLCMFEYALKSHDTHFLVKDTRSAGLSLAIGLLNVYRALNHKPQINAFIGTGILRIDGSIESTHKEEIKQTVIPNQKLITSNICPHVFELEKLMDKYQP